MKQEHMLSKLRDLPTRTHTALHFNIKMWIF
jgi:hypothetical protein